jgi:BirA family biotin operon repressor/biotin-[acetyl-CoA-carboxylase] ligase
MRSGEFVSGQQLAVKFGVTRVTIANRIKELKNYGLEIHKVRGKGYRLTTPLTLLTKSTFLEFFPSSLMSEFQLINFVDETESTNKLAMDVDAELNKWSLIASEFQTTGRGRRGRVWQSPYGSNLLFSLVRKSHWPQDVIYMASLISGLSLAETLSKYVKDPSLVKVKWPNDIYIDGRKLSGILCELQGSLQDESQLVIGVGLNVSSKPTNIDRDTVKLDDFIIKNIDRNELLSSICADLVSSFEKALNSGVHSIEKNWGEFDFLNEKNVRVELGQKEYFGCAQGINSKGELLVRDSNGNVRAFNGGEVSVRW